MMPENTTDASGKILLWRQADGFESPPLANQLEQTPPHVKETQNFQKGPNRRHTHTHPLSHRDLHCFGRLLLSTVSGGGPLGVDSYFKTK
eukprot:3505120-Amphidinium_carterae.1